MTGFPRLATIPSDFDAKVRRALQCVCLFGALGFWLGSYMVGDVSPEEKLYNSQVLPWLSLCLLGIFFVGFVSHLSSHIYNFLSIAIAALLIGFLVYSRLFILPFEGDFRLQLEPISFWVLLVLVSAFAFLDLTIALIFGAIYSVLLMTLVFTHLHNHGNFNPGTGAFQSWLQHYVLGLPSFVASLYVFALFKEKLFEARLGEQKLLFESQTDQLTQLNNRRAIDFMIDGALATLQRNELPFTAILLDIDHFKRVNDDYGHKVGDEVLKLVAKTLEKNIRSSEWCGRWGGEEFFIGIHGNLEAALLAAERFRVEISRSKGPQLPRITASFGVAEARRGESRDSVLVRADKALYSAKHSGRNCVRAQIDGPEEIAFSTFETTTARKIL